MTTKEHQEKVALVYEKYETQIAKLKQDIIDLREEVQHYRSAVAAVKWLWDRAGEQMPFQI